MRYVEIAAFVCCLAFGSLAQGKVLGDVAGRRYDIGRIVEEVVPPDKADTLIVYSANWCIPCQLMKPMWSTLRGQGYRVVVINTSSKTSKQKMTVREKEIFLDIVPKKVPTIYWYNSRDETRVGEKHEGSKITPSKIKERLWKPSSSTGYPLGRRL